MSCFHASGLSPVDANRSGVTPWAGWLAAGLMCAAMAQAAPISSDTPPNGSTGSTGGGTSSQSSAVPSPAKAGTPGAVSTGNKNLDLLLEMRSQSGDADKGGLTSARGAASAVGGSGLRAPANAATNSVGTTLLSGESGLAGAQTPSSQQGAKREWSGSGAMTTDTGSGGGTVNTVNTANERDRPTQHSGGDDTVPVPKAILQFMREHRYWVAGFALLLLGVGGALTGYSRRK